MISNFAILCVGLVGFTCAVREIPDYIHVCKRSDPHVAKCIRESVEVLRPRLKQGIPELDVPSLEPLHINEITIFRGDPPSNLKAFLRNVKVHGASDFQITKLKVNVDKNTYRVGVKFRKMTFDGDYDIDARVLVVPIKGTGKFSADISDVDGQGVLKAEIIEKNGHREIKFTSFDFAIKIADYNIHLDNLFNGDEVLSRAAMDVIHDNKAEFIQAALPFIQRKTAEILLDAANKITEDLDYDQVFPEK
ncbi:protein takeout-like [Tribolium madens]|uniref:protein takeout-like n=1 Tax=Tribolium madens TaxID=41895 RepID=UPI001CF7651D|nr:protein takeout-like [Tribolium madens]